MDILRIKEKIKVNYDINAVSLEKIKNVYKIRDDNNECYCLKLIKYNYSHFIFIISAMKHLQSRGFEKVPEIIKTNCNNDYLDIDNCFAYLTKWVDSRQCSYDNPIDVLVASKKLAELHKKSEGFQISSDMEPRIGWFKWINNFETRKNEILNFVKVIYSKDKKSEFDCMYLKNFEDELDRADRSITNLAESEYIHKISEEINKRGFCHHDFAHHNILIEKNGDVNIIDFDYCLLDTHLHDLASLLIRRMKNGKWDLNNACFILDSYDAINQIYNTDIPILAAFMEFPQDFWQVGIQYYWEKQPWGEEFFVNKLKKLYLDNDEKQDFIDEFRFIRYK